MNGSAVDLGAWPADPLPVIAQNILYGAALCVLFVVLAYVCDEGLAPALEELSDKLELPHDVACATFLAFGSSAPEIFINTSAAFADSGTEISLGAIYGSALISFTLIPAGCVFVSQGQRLVLQVVPMLRDTFFFSLSMAALLFFTRNSSLDGKDCSMLLVLFFVYLGALKALAPFYSHNMEPHHFVLPVADADEEALQAAPSLPWRAYFLPPFSHRTEKQMESAWPCVLISSMIYVSVISATVLKLSLALSSTLGLPMHLTGLVIVANGAEIPDTFASMAVAKAGQGPSSISATMGSQITNILIGIAFPYLVSNILRGTPVVVLPQQHHIGTLLGLIIVLFLVLAFRRFPFSRTVYLSKLDGIILVLAYISVIAFSAFSVSRDNVDD